MKMESVAEEVKRFRDNDHITIKTFRIQAYHSIICGCFCIGFIDSMFIGKSLLDFTKLFSPDNWKKSDKSILNYFLQYSINKNGPHVCNTR